MALTLDETTPRFLLIYSFVAFAVCYVGVTFITLPPNANPVLVAVSGMGAFYTAFLVFVLRVMKKAPEPTNEAMRVEYLITRHGISALMCAATLLFGGATLVLLFVTTGVSALNWSFPVYAQLSIFGMLLVGGYIRNMRQIKDLQKQRPFAQQYESDRRKQAEAGEYRRG